MIEIAGMYEGKTKAGDQYFSGYLGKARLLVFKNKEKQPGSKEPDWKIFLDENKKYDDAKAHPNQQTQQAPLPTQPPQNIWRGGSDAPF